MDDYAPEQLTPFKIAPVEYALPYGLTWEDLQLILPGFEVDRVDEARAFETYRKQGVHGGENSHILMLRFPIAKGKLLCETVFIKNNPELNKAEAEKYRFLAARGVAVPLLLGVFDKGAGEVIIQEFLEKIGIDFHSPGEVNSLICLTADLNAIRDLPRFGGGIPSMPQEKFNKEVKSALAYIAAREDMPEIDPARWFGAYKFSRAAVFSMPQVASHAELGFGQVGWVRRESGREIVLFDLETLCLSALFTDISGILYSLSVFTGRQQEELFSIYLERLAKRTGERMDFAEAMREMCVTRIRGDIESLPWLVFEAQNPASAVPKAELAMRVQCLKEDIARLGLA